MKSQRSGHRFATVFPKLQFGHFALFLLLSSVFVGCGDRGGVVATEDEMKAHVDKYGDLSLDPAASTDIKD